MPAGTKQQSERPAPTRTDKPDTQTDPFILESVFKDPFCAFVVPPSVEDICKNCAYVFDTNTLLAPYLISKESLKDVGAILTKLVRDRRLYLPAQSLREFAKNRHSQLTTLYAQLGGRLNKIPTPDPVRLMILEGTAEHAAMIKAEESLKKSSEEYKRSIIKLMELVRSWNWNDPVTKMYAEVFSDRNNVIEPSGSKEALLADMKHRYAHQIPPGFKDSSKADGGIGDFLIWHSILRLGRDRRQNVVFVSGEEKNDWVIKGLDHASLPRFELTSEFHEQAGAHLAIINFARLLDTEGAKSTTVEQVRDAAKVIEVQSGQLMTPLLTDLLGACANFSTICEFYLESGVNEGLPDIVNSSEIRQAAFDIQYALERYSSSRAYNAVAGGIVLTMLKAIEKIAVRVGVIENSSVRMKREADIQLRALTTQCKEYLALHAELLAIVNRKE